MLYVQGETHMAERYFKLPELDSKIRYMAWVWFGRVVLGVLYMVGAIAIGYDIWIIITE